MYIYISHPLWRLRECCCSNPARDYEQVNIYVYEPHTQREKEEEEGE